MMMMRVRVRVVRVVGRTSTSWRTDRDGASWLEFFETEEFHVGEYELREVSEGFWISSTAIVAVEIGSESGHSGRGLGTYLGYVC